MPTLKALSSKSTIDIDSIYDRYTDLKSLLPTIKKASGAGQHSIFHTPDLVKTKVEIDDLEKELKELRRIIEEIESIDSYDTVLTNELDISSIIINDVCDSEGVTNYIYNYVDWDTVVNTSVAEYYESIDINGRLFYIKVI